MSGTITLSVDDKNHLLVNGVVTDHLYLTALKICIL